MGERNLLEEYFKLDSLRKQFKYEGIVAGTRYDTVDKVNVALTGVSSPFLIYCDARISFAVNNVLRTVIHSSSNGHLSLSVPIYSNIVENTWNNLFEWARNNNIQHIILDLSYHIEGDMSKQTNRLSMFLNCLNILPESTKLSVKIIAENEIQPQTLILSSLCGFYSLKHSIIFMHIHISSTCLDIKLDQKWNEFYALFLQQKNTLIASIQMNTSLISSNSIANKIIPQVIQRCMNSRSILVHKEDMIDENIFLNINPDRLIIHISNKQQTKRVIQRPFVRAIEVELTINEIEKVISSLSKIDKVIVLQFTSVPPTQDPQRAILMYEILPAILPLLTSLTRVTLNDQDLGDLADGALLHKTYLQSKRTQYLETLIQNRERGRYNRAKIMVLGDGEAGKSSTIRSLSGQKFESRHLKTVVATQAEVLDLDLDNWKQMNAGSSTAISTFARDLKYVSLTVIKTKQESQNIATTPPEQTLTLPQSSVNQVFEIALEERPEEESEIDSLRIKDEEMMVSQLKALDNPMKLSIWDFGGQREFDSLHPLYLTDYGLYFVVFNLEKYFRDIQNETLKLRTWINSISLYAPHSYIILIGTRAQSVILGEKEMKEVKLGVDRLLSDFHDLDVRYNEELGSWIYPVENSIEEGIQRYLQPIKEEIRRILNSDESNGTWAKQVELSWMYFMHNTLKDNQNVVSLDSIEKEGLSCGFSSEEVSEIIEFFASAGSILDFRPLFKGKDTLSIVMKPHWLLEALGVIISLLEQEEQLQEMRIKRKDGSRKLVDLLKGFSILSSTIFNNITEGSQLFKEEEKTFVLDLCERNLIIAKLNVLPEAAGVSKPLFESNTFWIVPSYFAKEERHATSSWIKVPKKTFKVKPPGLSLMKDITWADKVPMCLFESFICCVVKYGSLEEEFKLDEVNSEHLAASLAESRFEIIFDSLFNFVLQIFSPDISIIQTVILIIRRAYKEVCTLNLSLNIAGRSCFFNQLEEDKATTKQKNKYDVFFSYCKGLNDNIHRRVLSIGEKLSNAGFTFYLGNEEDSEATDFLAAMEVSTLFIPIITAEYLSKSNIEDSTLGKQLHYACTRDTTAIVPVVLEARCLKVNQWTTNVLNKKLPYLVFINFVTVTKEVDNFDVLINTIELGKPF